jgi:hypothetical protein
MPVPTSIAELSTTAGDNSPVGGDAPSVLDNHQRTSYSFIKELYNGARSGSYVWLGTGGGTADVITASLTPALTAYATGQTFRFISSGANTTNVTININSLGAKAITKNGSTALAAGDIPSGAVCEIAYDGTRFQLIGVVADRFAKTGGTISGNTTVTGDVVVSGGTLQLNKGADVASAAALPLITDGNYFDVTGTTTITSMDSMGVGTQITLHFDGALTLTHHATDLILPGAANITTAAGDEAQFIEYASGDWRCTSYTRASGQGVNYSITKTNASGTSFDFTIPSWAKKIRIAFYNISTNGTDGIRIQLGDAGGIEGTGYLGAYSVFSGSSVSTSTFSGGFDLAMMAADASVQGNLTLINIGTNDWSISGTLARSGGSVVSTIGGTKPTSDTLTTVRITTTGATNTFDAGLVAVICT